MYVCMYHIPKIKFQIILKQSAEEKSI